VLLALGDLLDRPVHGLDPGAAIVVTPSGTIVATAGSGEQMDLVVAARVDVVVDLLTALEGTPRVEGIGARLTTEGESVRVALQAGDGAAAVLLDPVVSVDLPLELPSLAPFIPPDAYVVQPADTGEGLAERFLDDPSAFADLSDHPLVVGETLVLPGEAVPGWVALAAEPLPDPPSAATWFSVVADDILSAVFDRGDPAPLHNLIIAMQSPPPAMADPVDVVIARVQGLGAFVALGAGAGVAEGRPVDASEGDELGGL
jgi:hypothetical protein